MTDATTVTVPTTLHQRARIIEFSARGARGRVAHCLTAGLRVDGPLDVDDLRARVVALTHRHPALRATFPDADTHVLDGADPVLRERTVHGVDAVDRWRAAGDLAVIESETPFDPTLPIRLRVLVVHADPTTHLLVIAVDPLVCDAWSAGRLVEELLADPESGCAEDEYVNVWRARADWLLGPLGAQAARRRRVAVEGALLRWPWADGGGAQEAQHGMERYAALDAALVGKVRTLVRRERSTLLSVGAAALALTVQPVPGPLALRSTLAARETPEETVVVGAMANHVVLAIDPGPGEQSTVSDFLRRLRSELFACLGDLCVPFDVVKDALVEGAPDGRSAALVFLPRDLSGGEQRDLVLGTARVSRTAVSVCPTGADVDFYLLEGAPPMRSVAAAELTIGACSWRGDQASGVDRLLARWAAALEALADSDAGASVASVRDHVDHLLADRQETPV